ncbi:MAG: aldose epimerase family protein [Steroidobacter sp.]
MARAFIASWLTAAVFSVAGTAQAAQVSRAEYGVTAKGESIEAFTLENARGVSVRILTYGGVISELRAPDRDGRCENVVLSFPNLGAYENRANFSSLLGRYANRISGGGFELDGRRYELKSGANGISSHGGPGGYGARRWSAAEFQGVDVAGVVLHDLSFDGENGFPGNVSMQVTFTLTAQNTLRIEYRGTTDRPTVLNPSHHVYFNLAGAGTIFEHRAQVFASRYTPIDERKLPIGSIESVAGTPLDLRTPVRFAERIDVDHSQIRLARGFDHNFVLDKRAAGELTLAARIEEPKSGRVVEVHTTEPGLQVFTANGFDGSLKDARDRPLERGAGVALETQHFPDSPNHADFPSTVLRPGETFRSVTEYRLRVAGPGGLESGSCSR